MTTGEQLARMTSRFRQAKGATRAALARSLRDLITTAIAERHELDTWLSGKETWFARNADSLRFAEREDQWIAILESHAKLSEAVGAAEAALGQATTSAVAWTVRPGTAAWDGWVSRMFGGR